MRDMLYSEVASIHGLRNIPDNPALAVEVGKQLCTKLLEPLHATFGCVSIRSAFRSAEVNSCGEQYRNVAMTEWNHARHVWDRLDKKDKKGATASVVIPWFVDYLKEHPEMSWKAMGWWIHDHLDYSEVVFFHNRRFPYAVFNIRWHETEVRRVIKTMAQEKKRTLTRKGEPEHSSRDHSGEYPGFPVLGHPNERYPDISSRR